MATNDKATKVPPSSEERAESRQSPENAELRQLLGERHLLHLAPYYALGKLARGFLHEISNPAAFMSLATQRLDIAFEKASAAESSSVDLDKLTPLVEEMHSSVQATQQLIQSLRMISRSTVPESIMAVELAPLLTSVCHICKANAPRGVVLEEKIDDLPTCRGALLLLAPTLSLLIDNAFDALDSFAGPRTVTVEAHQVDSFLHLSVSDNGPGMSQDTLNSAFVPGFTTHPTSEHAGLGLPLAREMLDSLDATLHIDSKPGDGTTVRVTVPLPSH